MTALAQRQQRGTSAERPMKGIKNQVTKIGRWWKSLDVNRDDDGNAGQDGNQYHSVHHDFRVLREARELGKRQTSTESSSSNEDAFARRLRFSRQMGSSLSSTSNSSMRPGQLRSQSLNASPRAETRNNYGQLRSDSWRLSPSCSNQSAEDEPQTQEKRNFLTTPSNLPAAKFKRQQTINEWESSNF